MSLTDTTGASLQPSDLATFLGVAEDDTRMPMCIQLAIMECQGVASPLPAGAAVIVLGVAGRIYSAPVAMPAVSVGTAHLGAILGDTHNAPPVGGVVLSLGERKMLRQLAGRSGAYSVDLMPANYSLDTQLPWWDTGDGETV